MLCKNIFAAVLISLMPAMAVAQSMSDDQVVNYIQKEKSKGTPDKQIGMNLLKQGVSTTQLQRIRRKYQNAQNAQVQQLQQPVQKDEDAAKKLGQKEQQDFLLEEDSLQIEDEMLTTENEVFGRNIFNNRLLTFQPSQNMATPQNYRLGAGDQVVIEVWGAAQQTFNKTISADGTVTIEGVGPIKLAGLSVSQANAALRSHVGQYYHGSNIQLAVEGIRSIQVQVLGEVRVPGTYTVSSLSSAFNALYSAGGISNLGTLRDIKVYRGGRQVSSIDVYDYILTGNSNGDVRLHDNDIVVVGPYDCIVAVRGNVKRPMNYEMKKSESVGTLLRYAGGFTGDAYKKSVTLTRKSGANYSVHTVDEFQFNNFSVDDADSVFVGATSQEFANLVEIRGAVERPGEYELGGNIRTVKELVAAGGGLRKEAFTNRVMIQRRKPDMTLEVLTVNMGAVMNGTAPDVPLRKYDVLFVPSVTDMQGERTLTIDGEVRFPGDYPYADGMAVEDLVLQAGGLTDAASVAKVDVYRRIIDAKATEKDSALTQNFSFSLKEGFVIDGEAAFRLQPFDQVVVRRSPVYQQQQNVTVDGAVNFTGTYAMSNKHYRLSDLIKEAGGLSQFAYAKGARLRRSLNKEERMIREQTIRAQQIEILEEATKGDKDFNKELVDSLLSMKINQGSTYLVSIDLEAALKNPDGPENVELQKGDVLYVPQYSSTVKVTGDVAYSVSMPYKKGKNLNYYIKHAGGYGDRARKNKVYSIGLNGRVTQLSGSSSKGIEPGCEIVVPTKTRNNRMSTAEILSIGSSSASIAAVIATIANLLK